MLEPVVHLAFVVAAAILVDSLVEGTFHSFPLGDFKSLSEILLLHQLSLSIKGKIEALRVLIFVN